MRRKKETNGIANTEAAAKGDEQLSFRPNELKTWTGCPGGDAVGGWRERPEPKTYTQESWAGGWYLNSRAWMRPRGCECGHRRKGSQGLSPGVSTV